MQIVTRNRRDNRFVRNRPKHAKTLDNIINLNPARVSITFRFYLFFFVAAGRRHVCAGTDQSSVYISRASPHECDFLKRFAPTVLIRHGKRCSWQQRRARCHARENDYGVTVRDLRRTATTTRALTRENVLWGEGGMGWKRTRHARVWHDRWRLVESDIFHACALQSRITI